VGTSSSSCSFFLGGSSIFIYFYEHAILATFPSWRRTFQRDKVDTSNNVHDVIYYLNFLKGVLILTLCEVLNVCLFNSGFGLS
jgi:hypothetical protein